MKGLEQHARRLASATAARRRRQLVAQVGSELSGASVAVEGTEVVANGGHLLRRWLGNASLRQLRRQP